MKEWKKIAILSTPIALIVVPLAYFAYVNVPNDNNTRKGITMAFYRCRFPPPGKSVEAIGEEQAIVSADKAAMPLRINGREVTTSSYRSEAEWNKRDKKVLVAAQVRKLYNIHE